MTVDLQSLIRETNQINVNNPDLQWQSCIKLGKLADAKNNPIVIDTLLGALELNHFALTRAHAAEALGSLGIKEDRIVDRLQASLKDPYQLVRSYSAKALGKLVSDAAVLALIECLKTDEFFGARAEAAEALKKICDGVSSENCLRARKSLEEASKKETGRALREVQLALITLGELNQTLNEGLERTSKAKEDYDTGLKAADDLKRAANKSGDKHVQQKADEISRVFSALKNDNQTVHNTMNIVKEKIGQTSSSLNQAGNRITASLGLGSFQIG